MRKSELTRASGFRVLPNVVASLMAICATACNSTRVHLYATSLTAAETSEFTEVLREAGFRVQLNNQEIPQGITGPLIVYSPAHEDLDVVTQIGRIMKSLGYSTVEYQAYDVENHVYSGNNIGVYPRPRPKDPHKMPDDMPGYFRGSCPDGEATLEFPRGQEFTFEYSPKGTEDTVFLKGPATWSPESLTLGLADGQTADFIIEPVDSKDRYGITRRVTLKPTAEPALFGCEFSIVFLR